MNLVEDIEALHARQMCNWPLAHDNYAALDGLLTRELWLDDGEGRSCARIVMQHNPERVRSTAADVSPEAISRRPCFLCKENQPPEQETVMWRYSQENGLERLYKIQINPYPIFKRHLTIASMQHEEQRCRYREMMALAHDLHGYVIMFNGEGCGASAPDHLHFQATLQGELPLCAELEARNGDGLDSCYGSFNELWMDNRLGRQLIYIRAHAMNSALISDMNIALNGWRRNALCWFKEDVWHFVYFPRKAGRPSCYGQEPGQYLVSPAAAEYGGVWVLPRKQDFYGLTPELIGSFYEELSCSAREMEFIYNDYGRVN